MDPNVVAMNLARLDVLSDKIDQQMCHLIHTETIKKFSHDPEAEKVILPPELHNLIEQKSYVLQLADSMGLNVDSQKSTGIHLTKHLDPVKSKYPFLDLAPGSLNLLADDFKNLSWQESDSHLASRDKTRKISNVIAARCAGKLNIHDSPPEVSLLGESVEFLRHRRSLPIFKYRQEILKTLDFQQVLVIAGDIGSGKTTQVPQYILEDAYDKKMPCRIVSIQPRRMNVIAAVDRVTAERGVTGERLVGYQVPLESRGTMNCPLTFCTLGVFLRTLNESDRCFKGLTHIIIDQAHERDRFTDLLLGFLRMRLPHYPRLRLVILCANVAPHTLASYFKQETVIKITIPNHPVSQFFLEDILTCTKFLSKQNLLAGAGTAAAGEMTRGPSAVLDDYISEAWFKGSEQTLIYLLKLVQQGAMSIDYQHSQTGITLLMAASIHGNLDVVKACISLGANPTIALKGLTPHDLANEFARPDVADLLWSYGQVFGSEVGSSIRIMQPGSINQDSPDEVLKSFYAKYSQDHANLDLVIEVLNFVQGYSQPGAVLVFLPGYSEVVELRDMITTSTSALKERLEVHTLHGYLPLTDFRKLFMPAAEGKRKVILTTNMAETSVFFEDVVCVIDSGLVRDREIEVVVTSPKRNSWISRTSVAQRLMHVRNGGLYFHLYPRSKLEGFQEHIIPEIPRHSLVDVCLFARVIIPEEIRLAQFFCSLPDGPPTTSVHQAVEILESIDALDSSSKVTETGLRLMELPLDPRLGKMVVVSVVLKCLDPVLTVACCLAREDPFVLPPNPDERKSAMKRKFTLVADNLSDHLALLRAYHLWEKASDEVKKRQENSLSSSVFETVFLLRVSMVGELRASGYIKGRGPCDIRNLNLHAETWTAIKAAITAGLYPNIARYCPINGSVVTHDDMRSQFHYSSTLLAQEIKINGLDVTAEKQESGLVPQAMSMQQPKICNQYPLKPWIVYGEKQRAGQFMILRNCTAISPVTLLMFAGHLNTGLQILLLPPTIQQALKDNWHASDDEDDDICEDEIRQVCSEFNLQHMTEHLVGFNQAMKRHKNLSKPRREHVVLKLNDYVGFIVDSYASQLLLSMRQKFQSIMTKCIREPGRSCTPSEDAVLRNVLSVLSSEEMSMHFNQPTGVGRRPTNVSADSMLVSPDLKPGDVFPVRRYATYTPPPKGYLYENKDIMKSSPCLPTAPPIHSGVSLLQSRAPNVDSVTKSFHSLNVLNSSWPTYGAPSANGRRIFKSYKPE